MHGEDIAEKVQKEFGYLCVRSSIPLCVGQVVGADNNPSNRALRRPGNFGMERPGIEPRKTRLVVTGSSNAEEYAILRDFADAISGAKKQAVPPPRKLYYYRCAAVEEKTVRRLVITV